MTSYRDLVIKQRGYAKKDAYPNTLGEKAVKDDPFDKLEQEGVAEEPEAPEVDKLAMLNEAADQFQKGFSAMQRALAVLPRTQLQANAVHYADTSALWSQEAFNSTRAAIEAEKDAG